ncbi:MAG TPA: hypothetical protein VGE12_12315 [Noviherbaspirillum sp.]
MSLPHRALAVCPSTAHTGASLAGKESARRSPAALPLAKSGQPSECGASAPHGGLEARASRGETIIVMSGAGLGQTHMAVAGGSGMPTLFVLY